MDIDALIEKNIENYNKKIEGKEGSSGKISANTSLDTKKIGYSSSADKDAAMAKAEEYYRNHSKPGSISAKANMVKQFNEKNNKN